MIYSQLTKSIPPSTYRMDTDDLWDKWIRGLKCPNCGVVSDVYQNACYGPCVSCGVDEDLTEIVIKAEYKWVKDRLFGFIPFGEYFKFVGWEVKNESE